jgi:hypothetical protein
VTWEQPTLWQDADADADDEAKAVWLAARRLGRAARRRRGRA